MSKRRHKRGAVEALLAVQTAPVTKYTKTQGRDSLKQFTSEFDAVEAEKQTAQKAQAEAQAEAQRESREEPLIANDILAGLDTPSQFLSVTTPQISDYSVFENVSPEELRATWRRSLSEWEDICNEGTLTESGRAKMFSLIRVNPTTDWRQRESWAQAYVLLQHADMLNEKDFVERPEQPEPEQKESFDDVLSRNSTESRAGRSRIADAMMSSMQEDVKAWFDAFYRSLESYFHYSLSESEVQSVISVMKSDPRTLWCSAKAWDAARRQCVRNGTLPNNLLYPAERFDMIIEESDTQSWEGRRELRRQERLLGVPTTTVEY